MSLGLLDLPSPAFGALDAALEALRLPALLRVIGYATACAWIGMRLYARFSDQARMSALRDEIAQTQRALALHDGNFSDLNALIRHNLRLSLRQLGKTLRPALIASVPVLFVLPWLSNRFAVEAPAPNATVAVCVQPVAAAVALHPSSAASAPADGCWRIAWPKGDAGPAFVDGSGATEFILPAAPRSNIVHKFTFFNWLIGNPDGYLRDSLPADRIYLELGAPELIAFGPDWMRGWEFWFFLVLIVASVILKLRWKLH